MSMSSDITLDTKTYSATVVLPRSTVRADATAELDSPSQLTVSHETQASGKISSVAYIDFSDLIPCDNTCGTDAKFSNVRAMFKLQYNPSDGVTGIDLVIGQAIDALKAFLADDAIMTKFKNREH